MKGKKSRTRETLFARELCPYPECGKNDSAEGEYYFAEWIRHSIKKADYAVFRGPLAMTFFTILQVKYGMGHGLASHFEGERISSLGIRMKRWLVLILQSLVTLALLCWLFRDDALREKFLSVAANCNPWWVAAGIGACGILNLLGVFRWRIFLRALNVHIPFWRCVQLYFIGALFNLFLIGAVGGDAVKAGYLIAEGHSKAASLFSVLLDRISGFGALIVTSLALIIWRYEWLMQSPVVAGLIYFVFLFLAVATGVLTISLVISVKGWQKRLPASLPFRKALIEIADCYAVFLRQWKGSLAAGLLSFIMLIAYFLSFYFSSLSIGENPGLIDFFAIMPAVDIITALPISLGGTGVREQLFQTLLGQLCGISAASALLISLGGFLFNALWCLPGAGFLPFYRGLLKNAKEAAL